MSHPTLQVVVEFSLDREYASTIAGVNPRPKLLGELFEKLSSDYVGMVNREVWLTLQSRTEFIETSLKGTRFPKCLELHKRFLNPLRNKEEARD